MKESMWSSWTFRRSSMHGSLVILQSALRVRSERMARAYMLSCRAAFSALGLRFCFKPAATLPTRLFFDFDGELACLMRRSTVSRLTSYFTAISAIESLFMVSSSLTWSGVIFLRGRPTCFVIQYLRKVILTAISDRQVVQSDMMSGCREIGRA